MDTLLGRTMARLGGGEQEEQERVVKFQKRNCRLSWKRMRGKVKGDTIVHHLKSPRLHVLLCYGAALGDDRGNSDEPCYQGFAIRVERWRPYRDYSTRSVYCTPARIFQKCIVRYLDPFDRYRTIRVDPLNAKLTVLFKFFLFLLKSDRFVHYSKTK